MSHLLVVLQSVLQSVFLTECCDLTAVRKAGLLLSHLFAVSCTLLMSVLDSVLRCALLCALQCLLQSIAV